MSTDEVRALFECAEKASEPERKFEMLQDALDLSDDLLAEESGSSKQAEILNNIRRSYIRRLLVQLTRVEMRKVDMAVWFNYVKLLVIRVKPEVDRVLQDDPELSDSLSSFINLWGEELIPLLQKRLSEL